MIMQPFRYSFQTLLQLAFAEAIAGATEEYRLRAQSPVIHDPCGRSGPFSISYMPPLQSGWGGMRLAIPHNGPAPGRIALRPCARGASL